MSAPRYSDSILLALIKQRAELIGMRAARDTCRAFLLEKTLDREGYLVERKKKIPRAWILEAMDRQKGRCPRCDDPLMIDFLTGDHLIPLAAGGKHHRRNIVAMHRSCNSAKGARDLIEDSRHSGVDAKTFLQRSGR